LKLLFLDLADTAGVEVWFLEDAMVCDLKMVSVKSKTVSLWWALSFVLLLPYFLKYLMVLVVGLMLTVWIRFEHFVNYISIFSTDLAGPTASLWKKIVSVTVLFIAKLLNICLTKSTLELFRYSQICKLPPLFFHPMIGPLHHFRSLELSFLLF
jgi:hypothetical protein